MARKEYYFSSESLSDGSPDKICDCVVENILDEYLKKDPKVSMNINSIILGSKMILGGEIKSEEKIDVENIARSTLSGIDPNQNDKKNDYSKYAIENQITFSKRTQERDRENVVEEEKIITGFAVDDSDTFMPITLTLAHSIIRKLNNVRKENALPILPDAKVQITIQYDTKGKPKRVDSVVVNTQHKENINIEELRYAITNNVVYKTIPNTLIDKDTDVYVNTLGEVTNRLNGSVMGMSGRRTVMDTYGSWARSGGDSIAGKDPHKIERCVSYMLRKAAKNVVASMLASKIEVQAAYAPGIEKPISLYIDTFGTGKLSDDKITKKIKEIFDLNPLSIVNELNLLRPIYHNTACYGHFGKNSPDFTWEMIDKMDALK